jgi:hypothetical protein
MNDETNQKYGGENASERHKECKALLTYMLGISNSDQHLAMPIQLNWLKACSSMPKLECHLRHPTFHIT